MREALHRPPAPAPSQRPPAALPALIGNRAMGRLLERTAAGAPAAAGGLTPDMLAQVARRLREAMKGWGTDEEAIYSSLAGRSQAQVDAIAKTYKERYKRDLRADLEDELSSGELRKLAVFNPQPAATPAATANVKAQQAASQLRKAMSGAGTDEEAIFATLTGRTAAELGAIKQAYKTMTQRTLEHDLRDELSGSELTQALRLLQQGVLQAEDELHLAMAGAGTDEATAFRVLEGMKRDPAAVAAMEQRYRAKYGDMVADLRGDLSGSEYRRAMKVVAPVVQDAAFEDCASGVIPQARALIPVGRAKVDLAISVLSAGWSRMTPAQKSTFNHFFDPSGTGDVDARFVADVLSNFRKIRRQFDDGLTFECEGSGGMCTGTRLYYTYGSNVHVCPYFSRETDATRKARDLVHELAHNALEAFDRPYYDDAAGKYEGAVTPRGPWATGIPVIGAVVRAIARSDTLYHPDAYSWFAFTVR